MTNLLNRSLISITVSALIASPAWAEAVKVGVVGAANPLVLVESAENIERELLPGDVVFLNDVIKTTESGAVQLMFLDRSAMTIAPNAEVKVDRFMFDPDTQEGEMTVAVATGAFRFIGGALSKKKPINIKTPTSTIGIRGGIVDGNIAADGATTSSFAYGEQMSFTDASGNTQTTTTPGSGFTQANASAPAKALNRQQMRAQAPRPAVKTAFNIAPAAAPAQLQQLQQQLQLNTPTAPTPPAAPADTPPAPATPETPEASTTPENAAQPPQEAPAAQPQENAQAETGAASEDAAQAPEPATEPTQAPQTTQAATETASTPQAEAKPALKPQIDTPLSEGELEEIRNNPKAVLEKFPNGGPKLAQHITKAIAADPSLAEKLGDIAEQATPAQASAVGAGLARAGRLWNAVDPQQAAELSQTVGEINNSQINRTFKAIGPGQKDVGKLITPPLVPTPRLSTTPIGSAADLPTQEALTQSQPFLGTALSDDIQQIDFSSAPSALGNVVNQAGTFGATATAAAVVNDDDDNNNNSNNNVDGDQGSTPEPEPEPDPDSDSDDFVDEDEDDNDAPPTSPTS